MNELYFVYRPSMKGTTVPVFYYTFAKSPEEAIRKVGMKWSEFDEKATAKKLNEKELNELVIATNNFG